MDSWEYFNYSGSYICNTELERRSHMQMHEVHTNADKQLFRTVPLSIYKDDANWIRPLDKDIEEVFDKQKNKFFKHGECTRWILKDDSGDAIGRIAAFVNQKYKQEQPTGGVGFFECIDDQKAANYMFDYCKQWLQEHGMEAMDGPINFGERDSWWGLQIEGFQEPLYKMNYNLPYYQQLFENYGFKNYFNQLCYSLIVQNRLQDKFYEKHDELSADPNYRAAHIKKGQIEKFAGDFAYIYNKAWASHFGGKEIDKRTVVKMMNKMKPVMDEEVVWFTYYKDEPIAFWLNLPDLNQFFKHFNGKLGLIEKLRLLWMKSFNKPKRFTGLVFGIIPDFQGLGVDGYMIVEAAKVIQGKKLYEDFEMQWIG